jgi:Ca2+-transporting ATPase
VSEIGLFSNLRLFAVVAASFALQIAIHHSPTLGRVFGIAPVSWAHCAAWVGLGCVPLLALEARKLLRRRASEKGKRR